MTFTFKIADQEIFLFIDGQKMYHIGIAENPSSEQVCGLQDKVWGSTVKQHSWIGGTVVEFSLSTQKQSK